MRARSQDLAADTFGETGEFDVELLLRNPNVQESQIHSTSISVLGKSAEAWLPFRVEGSRSKVTVSSSFRVRMDPECPSLS